MHLRTARECMYIRQMQPQVPRALNIHAFPGTSHYSTVTLPYFIWKSLVMSNINENTLYLAVDCSVVAVLSASCWSLGGSGLLWWQLAGLEGGTSSTSWSRVGSLSFGASLAHSVCVAHSTADVGVGWLFLWSHKLEVEPYSCKMGALQSSNGTVGLLHHLQG